MHRSVIVSFVLAMLAFLLPWGTMTPSYMYSPPDMPGVTMQIQPRGEVALGAFSSSLHVLGIKFPNWLACVALLAAAVATFVHVSGGSKTRTLAVGLAVYVGVHTLLHAIVTITADGRPGLAHLALITGAVLLLRFSPAKLQPSHEAAAPVA